MDNIDITKIALSRREIQKLKFVSANEPLAIEKYGSDVILRRLHDRGLIEVAYCDNFPYQKVEGVIGYPANAFRLSDAGRQYLNRIGTMSRDSLITRLISVSALLVAVLSLVLQFIRG